MFVTLLVPIYSASLGLGGAPFATWFWMIVGRLIGPFLCRYQADGVLWYIVYVVYGCGIHFYTFLFDLKFHCSLTSDLDHSSISLEYFIFYWLKWSNEVVDIFWHAGGCMVVHPNDKYVRFYYDFLWFVYYYILFIVLWSSTHMKYLDHFNVKIVTNYWNLSLIILCVKSSTVFILLFF